MSVIWKAKLERLGPGAHEFRWPRGSRAVSVGLDPLDNPCVWFLAEPERAKVMHVLMVTFTGDEAPDGWRYVGHVRVGALVLHVWDV